MNTDSHNPSLDLLAPEEVVGEEPPLPVEDVIAAPQNAPQGLFRLMNIHLIDSLSRGRVQTMGIDGGMALTGRNGRGKTSLLSLALLFAGVEPRDVVSQGKDSFIDYYLPNQTSYLVYEYERPDGTRRLVVVLSNSTADKIRFRFVNSHFRRDMFVTDDGQFVLNKEFRQRLVYLRIPHAEKLVDTYTDYRAIIQGWQPPHVDPTHRRYLFGMADVYAFTTYNRPLRHLEKLTKGMFSRKANFDDLQQVVADWVFEGKPSVGIQTERKRVESWPRDYNAYQSIMNITPLVDVARAHRSDLEAAEDAIREVKEKFTFLQDHLFFTKAQRESELSAKQTYLDEETAAHEENALGLTKAIQSAQFDIDACERNLKEIEAARQDYESKGVDEKRARAAQAAVFNDELRSVDTKLDLALGAARGIKAKFDKQINEENRLHNDFRAVALDKVNVLRDEAREAQAKIEGVHADALKVLDDSSSYELHRLVGEVKQRHGELARSQERAANPTVDASIQAGIDKKNLDLRDANKAIGESHASVANRQRLVDDLQAKSSKYDVTIGSTKQSITQQKDLIEEILRAHTPGQDSLLAFLRANRPDWSEDIAKVINPGLLHRTDLHPQLAAVSASLYGIALELEFVEAADEADESRLHEKLDEANQALDVFQAQLERTIEQQLELRKSIKTAADELTLARSALMKANSATQALEREVDELDAQQRKMLEAARQLAQAQMVECERRVRHAEQAHADFIGRIASKKQSLAQQLEKDISAVSIQLNSEIRDIQSSIEAHKRACESSIEFFLEQQKRELAGEGADVNVITMLENKREELLKTLEDIKSWSELLSEWQIWKKQVLPQFSLFQAKKEQRQTNYDQDTIRLQEATDAWIRKRDQVVASIKDCRTAIVSVEGQLLVVANCLEDRLKSYESTSRHEAFDTAWEANSLRAAMITFQQQITESEGQLRKLTLKMRTAFLEVPHAAPSTYFQDRLYNIRTETGEEVDARMTLRVVEDWFATEHDKSRRLLVADAKTIFGEIQGLHRVLQTFNKKLSSFNASLQEHLEHSSTVFDNLSELKISIYSGVEELDYWSVITKITNDREEWTQEDSLPSADAVAHLNTLLAIWDGNRGINAQFKSLVSIRGSVREQGNYRQFRNRTELENISSNGLSYLVLIILFLGFIGKVRGNAPVQLTWCVDELKAIDAENIVSLCNYLGQNRITLCTAFPDPDAETLMLFEHKYKLDAERRLVHCELSVEEEAADDGELELAWEDGE
ncbi:hypothetical protein C1X59_05335 [Pseudomonas sp. FW215-R2]|uniref:ATP-binding protein n=1 Tax=unclassified Pseudomonas TaxID=196821 RepID=UPI000C88CC29|nr:MULTISPECIES: ATP-binding protein [unclassified Pseudomonas]PMX03057.1 hypothetical protein C1X59_05335 [Pseudomonas sp. FW215-R2]PMX11978.1 hypothetical protein C1X60_05325 [Pseudomonas sp. FW215-L1]PMX25648.1 hypothetical protein C1X57_04065 [Pseudomonas sp. FW215-E1]PNA32650.1 hypothetical protein C1X58_03545 [Pseudomonas sp. FW215-R4]